MGYNNQDSKSIQMSVVSMPADLQASGVQTTNPPHLVFEMLMAITLSSNRSLSTC